MVGVMFDRRVLISVSSVPSIGFTHIQALESPDQNILCLGENNVFGAGTSVIKGLK